MQVASRLVLTVCFISVLSACGVIRDRSDDYREVSEGKSLVVPEWYQDDTIRPLYPVPKIDNQVKPTGDFELPLPPDRTAEILDSQFALEEVDGQIWLLINDTPGRTWPMIEKFLVSKGASALFDNAELGLIQSMPLEQGANSGLWLAQIGAADQIDSAAFTILLFKVSQGVKRNSSEVQVRVLGREGALGKLLPWPGETSSLEPEKNVLASLKDFMELNKDSKSFSLLANKIGGPSKVTLVSEGDAEAFIKLDLEYDRAWNVMSRSLRESGIFIVDQDRSAGIFYLYHKDEDSTDCPWYRWSCDDELKREYNHRVILDRSQEYIKVHVDRGERSMSRPDRLKLLTLLFEHVA
ncbi:MAG: outer membrane protein assembly factor BamC [Pseudomonadales bacterium]|uniref:Lipoprotein n=1 Tax=Oleiphilus messinensis TaxID=141451 RepID=A0A1Y0IB57_9GAMM|nr:outer membrane protein assembly factor BamC [Oleiphilus messinensis]ARU56623.1 lipoprotein [Oleiphilus messinensis]MCG8611244.1 outer membrane protein assembly factor BamC [Pseudomonadales bacterium]